MDSFEVWITRFISLTCSCFLFGIILQNIAGTGTTIANGFVPVAATTFAILFMMAVFQYVYDTILSKRIPKEKQMPKVGVVIQSLFFLLLELTYISQTFTISFLSLEGIIASLILVGISIVSFSLFTVELVDIIINNKLIQTVLWFIAGGASTSILLLIVGVGFNFVNIHIIERADIFLLTGFFSGAVISAISVFQKRQRLGKSTREITIYSEVLASQGVSQSVLFDEMYEGENEFILQDPVRTKEQMEETYPWLLIALSLLFLVLSGLGNNLNNMHEGLDVPTIVLFGLFGIITFWAVKILVQDFVKFNRNYQKWRRTWSDFMELIKLLSMSHDAAIIEISQRYQYRRLISGPSDRSLVLWIEWSLEGLSLTETIPKDLAKQRELLVNIDLYRFLKMLLESPHKQPSELEDDLNLLEKALKIFESIGSLQDEGIRQELVQGIFYASMLYEYRLPAEIFKDISPLIKKGWSKNNELFSTSVEHLSLLEDTPIFIIPNSLKWLPVILPVALWLSSILLG